MRDIILCQFTHLTLTDVLFMFLKIWPPLGHRVVHRVMAYPTFCSHPVLKMRLFLLLPSRLLWKWHVLAWTFALHVWTCYQLQNNKHLSLLWFKVTVYLQGCLTYKQCTVSSFSCRYLSPNIKLKLSELAINYTTNFEIKWIVKFFTTSKCKRPNHLLSLRVKANFVFC